MSTAPDGAPSSRPTVARGVSTVSGRPRSGVQRGVSTFSARSADQESRIHELLTEQSIQEELLKEAEKQLPPPTFFRRMLTVAGHVVLIVMLGVYSAAGGVAFVYLEKPNELRIQSETRAKVQDSRRQLFDSVWNHVLDNVAPYGCLDGAKRDINTMDLNATLWNETWTLFYSNITTYDEVLYDAAGSKVYVHKQQELQWNYPASMFFSATVITTIGYGNIAPLTSWGRVFCIVYAIFGIPLTLIAIADMGKLFADLIKFLYKKAKKRRLKLSPPPPPPQFPDMATDEAIVANAGAGAALTSLKVFGAMTLLIIYISLGGGMFLLWEKWSFLESFYFCFITMTTIGLGDVVPEHQMFMLLCTVYILIGLALTSTCIELARSEYEKSWQRMLEASKRLQLQKLMKKLGEQIEMAGGDLDLIQDLKNALGGKKHEDKPPPIVWYETTV